MAKWGDFTEHVDSYLGRLSPEQLAAVRKFQSPSATEGDKRKATDALMAGLGMDETQAAGLAFLAMRVTRNGGDDVRPDDMSGMIYTHANGPTRLVDRSAFASDEEYMNAILKNNFGLDGTIQTKKAAEEAAATAAAGDPIQKNIQRFLDSLDPNSPQTQAAYARADRLGKTRQNQMSSAAGLGSMGSGNLAGGLSAMGQAGIQGDLKAKYDLQRGSLQQAGLGLQNQRDLGIKGLELGYAQMEAQQAEQAWAAKQNQGQGIGAAIGTGIGALGFIGGPALGAATMAGGGALGGALGGMASRGAAAGPSYAKPPSWVGNKGRSGGGSGGSTGY